MLGLIRDGISAVKFFLNLLSDLASSPSRNDLHAGLPVSRQVIEL